MKEEREYQPDFDNDERERANAPRYQLAREAARALLAKYRIVTPPVDVESLVMWCGVELVRVELNSPMSGALYAKVKEIVVNTHRRSPERQRFTTAHELGHWQLQHYISEELPEDTSGYSAKFEGEGTSEGRSRIEIEANTFAAELLIPGPWIRKLRKPIGAGAPDRLAQEYQVSREAIFYQLMHCGRL